MSKKNKLQMQRDPRDMEIIRLKEENARLSRKIERLTDMGNALAGEGGIADKYQIERDQAVEYRNDLHNTILNMINGAMQRKEQRRKEYEQAKRQIEKLKAEMGEYLPVAATLSEIGEVIARDGSVKYLKDSKGALDLVASSLVRTGDFDSSQVDWLAAQVLELNPSFLLYTLHSIALTDSAYLVGAALCDLALDAQRDPGVMIDTILMGMEGGAPPDMAAIQYLYTHYAAMMPKDANKAQTLYQALFISQQFRKSGLTEEEFAEEYSNLVEGSGGESEALTVRTLKRHNAIRRDFESKRKTLSQLYNEQDNA